MTTKERRELAASRGICSRCSIRAAEAGKKSCEACRLTRNRTGDTSTRRREVLPANICCRSHGEHRFDCTAVEKRGAGPFLRRVA